MPGSHVGLSAACAARLCACRESAVISASNRLRRVAHRPMRPAYPPAHASSSLQSPPCEEGPPVQQLPVHGDHWLGHEPLLQSWRSESDRHAVEIGGLVGFPRSALVQLQWVTCCIQQGSRWPHETRVSAPELTLPEQAARVQRPCKSSEASDDYLVPST